jgi:hypothetical protein
VQLSHGDFAEGWGLVEKGGEEEEKEWGDWKGHPAVAIE